MERSHRSPLWVSEMMQQIRTSPWQNAERLQHTAGEAYSLSTAAFDAADPVALDRFFRDLKTIDHVMVTAGQLTTDASPILTSRRSAIYRRGPLAGPLRRAQRGQ